MFPILNLVKIENTNGLCFFVFDESYTLNVFLKSNILIYRFS